MGKLTIDPVHLRQRVFDRLPRGRSWYEIKNAAGEAGPAVIRIYSEIGYWGVTEEDFAAELEQIAADEIEVQIASPGGDVFAAIAIFNALRAHPARVTTRVDGIAASAASVIVQAGDHRVMLSSAQQMIHDAWGLAIGSAAEMRVFADLLDKQSDVIARIYADRSGGKVEEFRSLMADETWLSDEEAVEAGLADEVVTPKRQEASASASTTVVLADSAGIRTPTPTTNALGSADDDDTRFRSLVERLEGEGFTRTEPAPSEESAPEGSASLSKEGAAAVLAAFEQKEQADA